MVDLNADLGEIPGDLALMEVVTSANIACGGHAGDPETMRAAVAKARASGVAIGAHPSYLDREGFGRRETGQSPSEVAIQVRRQVESLSELAEVRYVKLHGALYHRANTDEEMAEAILGELPVRHLLAQEGALTRLGRAAGFRVTLEGFCDRAYRPDGSLVPRGEPGAVLTDPEEVLAQAVRLAANFGSLCLHGDTPGALGFARNVRQGLEEAGVEVAAFSEPPRSS
jgi:UPF0271 protein